MKKIIFIIALSIAPMYAWGNNSDPATEIIQGNINYHEKQYDSAVKIYERLIAEGYTNGHLYYNLGNAYFRLGQIGPDIHNYLKAKSLLPRDKDLDANLKSAFQETIDRLEGKQAGNIFLIWLENFNFLETLQILALANLLFWLSLTGWICFRSRLWDLGHKTTLALLILAITSASAKYYTETNNVSGVVLAKTADIKSTPEPDNVTLFQLHEGAVVSITGRKDDWYKIELPDDKKGWVKNASVGT